MRMCLQLAGICCYPGAARGQLAQFYGARQHHIGMRGGREPGWAGRGLQGRTELCVLSLLAEVHADG